MLNSREPAFVMEYDIATPPTLPTSALELYSQAFVVFRYGPQVLGTSLIDIIGGRLCPRKLDTAIRDLAWPIWHIRNGGSRKPTGGRSASVAICTRNRPDLLKHCLDSLSFVEGTDHEVLVIDNCPSDSRTEELVALYPWVRYFCETRKGAGAARNRALREAQRDFLAFTDDDARVDRFWLDYLLSNFNDPSIALVTGITMPVELETESQLCFERVHGFSKGFNRITADFYNTNPLGAGRLGASVNMAVRLGVLDEVGLFDEALGPGTLTQCGEDHEFFYRILAAGYRAVYDPCALVWHRHRRDYASLRATMRGYGAGVFAWWTRALFIEREFSVLAIGSRYLSVLFRRVIGSFLPGASEVPRDLLIAEFLGALAGPAAYVRAFLGLKRKRKASLKNLSEPALLRQ